MGWSRRLRSSLLVIVAALLLTGVLGCGPKDARQGDAPKAGGEAPREVATARAELGPYSRSVTLSGSLEAKDRVEVVARVEGPIVSVHADLGSRVERGALLAKIDAEDAAARAERAAAEKAQAEADLARVERLAETKMASPQNLEQARTRAAGARAEAALTARVLRDTAVRAPFAGGITRRDVSPGAYLRVGAPLFEMVSSESLRLVLEVPEAYAGLVTEGREARATIAGQAVTATLTRVAPAIDAMRRTFRVEADVPGAPGLTAGMFVTANLEIGTLDRAARVPRAAVFTVLGKGRVMRVTQGVAEARDVELLGEEAGKAIVLGLDAGDVVITRGPQMVPPGTAVRATEGGTDGEGPQAEPGPSAP